MRLTDNDIELADSVVHTRTQLFIPGPKSAEWFTKAVASGADAVIFDLEDATADEQKAPARALVATTIRDQMGKQGPVLIVRVNGSDTSFFLEDVQAAVESGADAIMLPKTRTRDDVVVLDYLIGTFEQRCHRPLGSTRIIPLLETASALRTAYDIGCTSRRIAYMGALSASGGDVEREVGFSWSPQGDETLAFRSQVLLDARAADIESPITGLWTDIADLDGLRRFAQQGRDIGYEGMLVIHPTHVPIVNEVFATTPEQLNRDRELVATMEAALASGSASIRIDGKMTDVAMLNSAKKRLLAASKREATR